MKLPQLLLLNGSGLRTGWWNWYWMTFVTLIWMSYGSPVMEIFILCHFPRDERYFICDKCRYISAKICRFQCKIHLRTLTLQHNYSIFSVTTEQLFCLQLKERRGKLNTPCLPSSTIGRGCTDSNTKCSAGNCVCRDGYYERNAACSKKLFQFFGKTPYWKILEILHVIYFIFRLISFSHSAKDCTHIPMFQVTEWRVRGSKSRVSQ